jgi:hypothetical protein
MKWRIRYLRQPIGWCWTLSRDGISWWHGHSTTPDGARLDATSAMRREREREAEQSRESVSVPAR